MSAPSLQINLGGLGDDLRDKLLKAPSNVHQHLDKAGAIQFNTDLCPAAKILKENDFTQDETVLILYQLNGHRPPIGNEIERATAAVFNSDYKKDKKKPLRDAATPEEVDEAVKEIKAAGYDSQLIASPEGVDISPKTYIEKVYRQGEWVCLATEVNKFQTLKYDEWMKKPDKIFERYQLRVPNSMKAKKGHTVGAKPHLSMRTKANSANVLSSVIFECDLIDKKLQLFIISYISQFLPLISVCDSGNKSYHAEFSLLGLSEGEKLIVLNRLITLGGDPLVMETCALIRTPNATRNDHKAKGLKQELIWLDSIHCETVVDKSKASLIGIKLEGRLAPVKAFDLPFTTAGNYLIKGLLDRQTVSCLYALPGKGKSFLALSMCKAISSGSKWHGHRVQQGAVLYVTLEGRAGFRKRIEALRLDGSLTKDDPFYCIEKPFHVVNEDHIGELIREIRELEKREGIKFEFIVIDTLARSMPGVDEDTKGMQDAADGATAISESLGCHIMLVHHSGKKTSAGARGGISLLGAVDTMMKCEAVAGEERTFELTTDKQKDGDDTGKYQFKLNIVELGDDEDGDPVTTCTVEFIDQPSFRVHIDATNRAILDLLPQPSMDEWHGAVVSAKLKDTKSAAKSHVQRNLESLYKTESAGVGQKKKVIRVELFDIETLENTEKEADDYF